MTALLVTTMPKEVAVYDEHGYFISANFDVYGENVWDAGTEVNDKTYETLPYNRHQMFVGGVKRIAYSQTFWFAT